MKLSARGLSQELPLRLRKPMSPCYASRLRGISDSYGEARIGASADRIAHHAAGPGIEDPRGGDLSTFGHDHRICGPADGFGMEIRTRRPHQLAPPFDREVGGPTVADEATLFGEGLERRPTFRLRTL